MQQTLISSRPRRGAASGRTNLGHTPLSLCLLHSRQPNGLRVQTTNNRRGAASGRENPGNTPLPLCPQHTRVRSVHRSNLYIQRTASGPAHISRDSVISDSRRQGAAKLPRVSLRPGCHENSTRRACKLSVAFSGSTADVPSTKMAASSNRPHVGVAGNQKLCRLAPRLPVLTEVENHRHGMRERQKLLQFPRLPQP